MSLLLISSKKISLRVVTSYPSLFFFIFIFSYNVLGLAAVEKQQDKVWEKLFHYHQGKPLIRDKKFLFTLDEKNLSSFSVSSERSFWENTFSQANISSLICRFPARYYVWSKGEKAPENFCPALAVFLSEFDVQNVALVFSSYYAQNAASLFGHTFLRFTRLDNKGQELLDWGISYSANMKNINTLSMIYKSFFSSFQGSLEVMPYYYKVREYNDFEFRPLWSYSLKVSGSEVKFLLYHLWELSQLDIPYQYLTHNCSSLILDVLNILKPQSNFRDGLAFYHIPIDTIKVLKKEGLLKQEVQYRASLMQEWESKFRALTIQEQKIFRQFSHTLDDRELTSERLIDTALDYYDFKYGKQLVSKDSQWSELQKQKNDLLIKRSKLSKTRYEPIKSPEISPDNVHPTRRISMGILRDDLDKKLLTISYRFAYHDPMDPIEGMTSRMKINFLQPEVVLDDHMNLRLQKIELLDIASWSYSPLNSLIR